MPLALVKHLQTGPLYRRCDYAGFLRRTAATLLDLVILAALSIGGQGAWYFISPATWSTTRGQVGVGLAVWAFAFVYIFGWRFFMNGTPGYRIMRIRYAYVLSGRPPASAVLLRSLSAILLMWVLAIDHFWILLDDRKQAWHDKISGFYVVKCKARPVGTAQVVQRIVNILGLSMVFLDPLPDQDEIAADSPSAVVPARPAQAPDAADSAPGEG
jgi:uncharacterized RDD family membrane protein YckC